MAYKIFLKPSAIKDLDLLHDKEVKRLLSHINNLSNEPRPIGVQKLSDAEGYRIRSGNYRVLFEVSDKLKTVFIYRVKHRKDVYKK